MDLLDDTLIQIVDLDKSVHYVIKIGYNLRFALLSAFFVDE